MTNEELNEIYSRAEDEYDNLKDRIHDLYDENKELKGKINKAIEVIDLIKPELWNISNKMTYRLLDIKNILLGEDKK